MTLTCQTNSTNATYQWKHNGIIISNQTESVLRISQTKRTDAGSYLCNVTTNGTSSFSPKVNITILCKFT